MGGGRAVGFTVDALEELSKGTRLSFNNLSILSLVGNNVVRRQAEPQDNLGDGNLTGDTAAFDLAATLGVDFGQVRFVHLPLTLPASLKKDVAVEVLTVLAGHF